MRETGRDGWLWRLLCLAFASLVAFAGLGCDFSQTTLPPPECPVLPTKWTFTDVGALGHTAVSPPGPTFGITPVAPGAIVGNIVMEPFTTRKVATVFAFLDAGENATPAARAVIYKLDAAGMPTGESLATSAEIRIETFPAHWYRFDFPDNGVSLGPGSYLIGIWTGGTGTTLLYPPGGTSTLTGFFAPSVPYDSHALPPVSPTGGQPGGKGWALYALYTDSAEVDPSAYTPSAPAETTTINLELGQLYMRYRIIDALQAKGIDNPYPEDGVAIDNVQLVQGSANDANSHTLVVTITPWHRVRGEQVSLQRSYRLTLKLTPFLLTRETQPDASTRQLMLGKDENGQSLDNGIAIRFDLVELRSLSYNQPVDCKPDAKGYSTNPNFDEIDKQVLAALSKQLASQHPFVLPTKAVTDVFSSLGPPATIDGVNLGTDHDFKLGMRIKDATGQTFDPQTTLSRFPSTDWAIDIDPAFMKSAIGMKATNEADGLASRGLGMASADAARVEIDPGGIVRIYQPMQGCGSGNLGNMYVRVRLAIARIGADAPPPGTRYVLNAPQDVDFDGRVRTCLNTKPLIWAGGLAFSRVGQCEVLSDIQFKISPNDWFYAAALDTDGVFYIAGRSTFVDASRTTVPTVPTC